MKVVYCIYLVAFAFILGMGVSLIALKIDETECQTCYTYCESIGIEQGCSCVPNQGGE